MLITYIFMSFIVSLYVFAGLNRRFPTEKKPEKEQLTNNRLYLPEMDSSDQQTTVIILTPLHLDNRLFQSKKTVKHNTVFRVEEGSNFLSIMKVG